MKIPHNKKWLLLEREDYANYLFVVMVWQAVTCYIKRWGFAHGGYNGAEYINSACNLFFVKDDFDRINNENFKTLFNHPQRWDKLHRLNKKNADKLFNLAKKIKKLSFSKLSNQKLLKWVDTFQKTQVAVHLSRAPMWF